MSNPFQVCQLKECRHCQVFGLGEDISQAEAEARRASWVLERLGGKKFWMWTLFTQEHLDYLADLVSDHLAELSERIQDLVFQRNVLVETSEREGVAEAVQDQKAKSEDVARKLVIQARDVDANLVQAIKQQFNSESWRTVTSVEAPSPMRASLTEWYENMSPELLREHVDAALAAAIHKGQESEPEPSNKAWVGRKEERSES